jgi:hypothetical protein
MGGVFASASPDELYRANLGRPPAQGRERRRLASQAHDQAERDALMRMAEQCERLAEHKTMIEGRKGLTRN